MPARVVDLGEGVEVDTPALVSERLIPLDVLEHRHVARADRRRQVGLELALDPHLVREVDDVVDAFHLPDLDRWDVA